MSMPFYVAPEQFMKDKADFARKNVGRGRPLVAVVYAGGVLLCAENPSRSLNKISEIYDRIAFAGVGRYNEFDQLRRSGVQYADVQGYQYSREDVDARSLANLYAQYMGNVFTHEMKPLEVEILVVEVGTTPNDDQLFHIHYDGVVQDEGQLTALGGEAETIAGRLRQAFDVTWDLPTALRAAVAALAGPDRVLAPGDLEVAVLERANARRAFHRILGDELAAMIAPDEPEPLPDIVASSDEPAPATIVAPDEPDAGVAPDEPSADSAASDGPAPEEPEAD